MNHPLSHLRVLDMSRILAGPWAGQLFADLGAEVIKIERPGSGDDTRGWGPPFLEDTDGNPTSEAAYFLCANRGKKSVTLDITQPEGQKVIRKLAAESDILIENYKVGGLSKYGLDYESLKEVNPKLVYCSITGFGQSGPYSNRAGYDFLIQAMGGFMSITGERDAEPGGGPQKIGVALSDVLTGLYTVIAALSAVAQRDRTGTGQHIDMALLDVTTAACANQALNFLVTGNAPTRMGNAHPNIVPYEAFATADHYVILAVGNDSQYRKFCEVAGRVDLADDPKYATNVGRVENRAELVPILRDIMKSRPRAEWMRDLETVGVPCGPINDLEQVFDDPQIKHREMQIEMTHPLAGPISLVANPINFSDAEMAYDRPPPLLGSDTDDVLSEIGGFSADDIKRLRDGGVV